MADSPKLANCKYENFVVNSSQQKKTGAKGRVDLFLDKFYSEDKIAELMKTSHVTHVRNGHQINIRKFEKN